MIAGYQKTVNKKINSLNISIFFGIFFLCATVSYSIVYSNIQNFSLSPAMGNLDTQIYLSMYKGEPVQRYEGRRVLVPFLARSLPDFPPSFFAKDHELSGSWTAIVKFGVVNYFFLTAAGIVFFYYLKQAKFSNWESVAGCLLFYSARPVVQNAGLPLPDAASYFFLAICFYSIQVENRWLLFVGFLLGIFAKESVFLVIPALLFSEHKLRSKMLYVLIPGIVTYSICHCAIVLPRPNLTNMLLVSARYFIDTFTHVNRLIDLFSSFGLLWLPAFFSLTFPELPIEHRRWKWLIPFMLAVIFIFSMNLGRILFVVFPVVIPLSLFGLRRFLAEKSHGSTS